MPTKTVFLVMVLLTCLLRASAFSDDLTTINRVPGGTSVLPTGRRIQPLGTQITVPPHPYGLALSENGQLLVASSNGVGPFALTLLHQPVSGSVTTNTISAADEPEFKSAYQGVAVSPDGKIIYASGGNDGNIHLFDTATRKRIGVVSLDDGKFADSITGDCVLSPDGKTLFVVDPANYRLALMDTQTRQVIASAPTGRIPFAVAVSPTGKTAFVANIGLFEYQPVEKRDGKDPKGLAFAPFGFPSPAARDGATVDERNVAGLGPENAPEGCSVWGVDVQDPNQPRVRFRANTGIPIRYVAGEKDDEGDTENDRIEGAVGGSAPCALIADARFVYVSNAQNDTVEALDPVTGKRAATIALGDLLPRRLRTLRGLRPYGLALSPDKKRLYVALSGFNAVAIVDVGTKRPLGLIPTAWYPSRLALSPNGKTLFVASAKGYGSGPNAGSNFTPGPDGSSSIGNLMKGTVAIVAVPADRELRTLSARTLVLNNVAEKESRTPQRPPIQYVVFITKENRTFDEAFGALPDVRGDASLARFGTPRKVEGIGTDEPVVVMPNHLALARRFAISDNFYVDSDHSADGHRWLVGVAPNHWTEGIVSASYGGQMDDKSDSSAPGRREIFGSNSSAMPEDYPEAGTLWHHLARHNIPFRNWGEGFEFAGIDEGPGLKPTGARLPLNIPMPLPLFKNTSRRYPGYNTNIPDQYRADVFLEEFAEYENGKKPLPRYLYLHLPNDHGAGPRPNDGYPATASFMADNDVALGRIIERLSHSRFWKNMAIFVTEDDAQGGVDSVDAHRSVLMVLSPWAKKGYIARGHADIASIHHEVFGLLGLPPLSLYDALAADLSAVWTQTPDFTAYTPISVDPRLFDPAKAKDPNDPDFQQARLRPHAPLDDPDEVERLRRADSLP